MDSKAEKVSGCPHSAPKINCDTFLRFKGLERPAVIVTDLRLVSNLYETRMHIAVARAFNLLRIVGQEAEIRKDPRLVELISVMFTIPFPWFLVRLDYIGPESYLLSILLKSETLLVPIFQNPVMFA